MGPMVLTSAEVDRSVSFPERVATTEIASETLAGSTI